MMDVLVGGIGYRNLRDYSFGVMVVDVLATQQWPANVFVEDLSYSPIAVVQRLQDDSRFDRAVIVAAVQRAGRTPGDLTAYVWDRALPGADEIQAAVSEAVTGVIALDNTLIVAQHFAAWPRDVVVIEMQPATSEFGDELSQAAAQALPRACEVVRSVATDPSFTSRLPTMPVGGGTPRVARSFRPQVSDVWSRNL
jgi:hydrogenase maturation protease